MIAQTVLTTAASTKAEATLPPQLQPSSGSAFLALLSTTDASLTSLAQSTGASVANLPQAANVNKLKTNDPTGPAYAQAQSTLTTATKAATTTAGGVASVNAPGAPSNPALPATGPSSGAAQDAAAGAATGSSNASGSGNSTGFGADQLNARIAAGAPIFASQPSTAMATVPAHLLDAAAAQPQTGLATGKAGDDAATTKSGTEPGNAMATANANTPAPPSPLLTSHTALGDQTAAATSDDKNASSAPAADTNAANDTSDTTTPSASLVAQPNTPATTPIQIDAAVHTAAPYVPVGEQVALNLKQAVAADNNEIRIQLKPASLGTIDVKLNLTQDGRVSAVISADRSDTLNMLKQDSGTLQQALRDAGLNADANSLNFSLRGDAQSFAQNGSQGGTSNGSGNRYASGSSDASFTADPAAPVQRVHSGSLDIEV